MTEKDLEVIEILNKWGPEAMRLGLITEKEVYQALGSSSDKGGYNYDKIAVKAGGGMMNMDEMIRPIGMAGGGLPKEEQVSASGNHPLVEFKEMYEAWIIDGGKPMPMWDFIEMVTEGIKKG